MFLQDVDRLEDIPQIQPSTFGFDLQPTKENIVTLALTLEHNESYFKLMKVAVEGLLTYMAKERQFLQEKMENTIFQA
ncbi:hypothetical protein GSI_09335 [Ganoderma sinense ZZ0214-1]|uniref:Uncharacterized protein n=1 Tax=Ganoderma sinense ZZ0214-1 TaxID=1077348 RepID=A0A2G8S6C5_9APHY|nr:hypothetical protein GSI_09335 [Ganoderma sinense ZZ0214-1]